MTKTRSIRKRQPSTGKKSPVSSHKAPPVRILVTAGPTHEPIDAVRYIGNRSSGAMGIAIAEAAAAAGNECTLLLGPTSLSPTHSSIRTLRFRTTADLEGLLAREFPKTTILIMAAAVADYRPKAGTTRLGVKIPRQGTGLTLKLEPTPDLLAGLKSMRKDNQTLVGFALEPEETMHHRAVGKLGRKGLDLIVANPLETMDAADIRAEVISAAGVVLTQASPVSKRVFARKLVHKVLAWHRASMLN